jgi:hypothetical protein
MNVPSRPAGGGKCRASGQHRRATGSGHPPTRQGCRLTAGPRPARRSRDRRLVWTTAHRPLGMAPGRGRPERSAPTRLAIRDLDRVAGTRGRARRPRRRALKRCRHAGMSTPRTTATVRILGSRASIPLSASPGARTTCHRRSECPRWRRPIRGRPPARRHPCASDLQSRLLESGDGAREAVWTARCRQSAGRGDPWTRARGRRWSARPARPRAAQLLAVSRNCP